MPKKTREPFAAGGLDNPAAQFREFTAECLELAQRTRSPEKRLVYLDLARVCFKLGERFGSRAITLTLRCLCLWRLSGPSKPLIK
jgi:hypothetical protein